MLGLGLGLGSGLGLEAAHLVRREHVAQCGALDLDRVRRRVGTAEAAVQPHLVGVGVRVRVKVRVGVRVGVRVRVKVKVRVQSHQVEPDEQTVDGRRGGRQPL